MKVHLMRNCYVGGRVHKAGETLDVAKENFLVLVGGGRAEPAEPAPKGRTLRVGPRDVESWHKSGPLRRLRGG